jgi:hydrogenase expression/formation protein HypC
LHPTLIEVNVASYHWRRKNQQRETGVSREKSEEPVVCLGVPMRIVSCDGLIARCEAKGIERAVNLFLLQHEALLPGDHVMVHVGYAIQKMSQEDAASTWELLDQMLTEEELQGNA